MSPHEDRLYILSRSAVEEVKLQQGRARNRIMPTTKYSVLGSLFFLVLCSASPTSAQQTREPAFSIVERIWTPEEFSKCLNDGVSIWAEGEVLFFCHRSAGQKVQVQGSLDIPLQRIGHTDLWGGAVEIRNLAEAVIQYRFWTDSTGANVVGDAREVPFQYWRGPLAPDAPETAQSLSGTVYVEDLRSELLGESRPVTVYLPPGHTVEENYPVIYMADGQDAPEYASVLEPLILAERIPPTILVGVHSGTYQGEKGKKHDPSKDLRSIEYLLGYADYVPGVDSSRFEKHEGFFLHEVGRWAETQLGAASDGTQRLLFGTSNGAAFGISMGIRNPQYFGKILAFSSAWGPAVTVPDWKADSYPRYYLAAGTLDSSFYKTTSKWAKILKSQGFEHLFQARVSGHDSKFWQEEFARAVGWALGR